MRIPELDAEHGIRSGRHCGNRPNSIETDDLKRLLLTIPTTTGNPRRALKSTTLYISGLCTVLLRHQSTIHDSNSSEMDHNTVSHGTETEEVSAFETSSSVSPVLTRLDRKGWIVMQQSVVSK